MEIAEGLQRGNRDAWLSLYELYAEKLWCNIARLMAHDPACVADVVQETLLSAARSAKNFNPRRGSLWAWLWTIAKRQVALHYRKQNSKAIIARAQQWWSLLDGQTSDWINGREKPPTEVLESAELAILVRYTLTELSAEYQRLLMAKYVDGLTIEDISEETNDSSVAIRSKLARARKAFRLAFKRLTHSTPSILEMAP
ncbi:MAG: RNA polymerase sigma factor [Planctomycetes bacterium]|nr:RNA polymerase sigma factor [Planctomycetota bacterium]